jgi:hypothetical protein
VGSGPILRDGSRRGVGNNPRPLCLRGPEVLGPEVKNLDIPEDAEWRHAWLGQLRPLAEFR